MAWRQAVSAETILTKTLLPVLSASAVLFSRPPPQKEHPHKTSSRHGAQSLLSEKQACHNRGGVGTDPVWIKLRPPPRAMRAWEWMEGVPHHAGLPGVDGGVPHSSMSWRAPLGEGLRASVLRSSFPCGDGRETSAAVESKDLVLSSGTWENLQNSKRLWKYNN